MTITSSILLGRNPRLPLIALGCLAAVTILPFVVYAAATIPAGCTTPGDCDELTPTLKNLTLSGGDLTIPTTKSYRMGGISVLSISDPAIEYSDSTYLGYLAGTGGTRNTFVGYKAGQVTSGGYNTFIGRRTGIANTSGYNNVFVGSQAGQANTTAVQNTFIGTYSGISNEGSNNTFLGYFTGGGNTTGAGNVYLGYQAGYSMTTGSDNIIIGHNIVSAPTVDTSNFLNIGNTLYGNLSTKAIGIGTTSPETTLEVVGTMSGSALNISDAITLQPRSAAPGSPSPGTLYVDSDTDELCFYDGASWTGLKAGGVCE